MCRGDGRVKLGKKGLGERGDAQRTLDGPGVQREIELLGGRRKSPGTKAAGSENM